MYIYIYIYIYPPTHSTVERDGEALTTLPPHHYTTNTIIPPYHHTTNMPWWHGGKVAWGHGARGAKEYIYFYLLFDLYKKRLISFLSYIKVRFASGYYLPGTARLGDVRRGPPHRWHGAMQPWCHAAMVAWCHLRFSVLLLRWSAAVLRTSISLIYLRYINTMKLFHEN